MNIVIIEDEKPSARFLERLLKQENLAVDALLHSVEESVNWLKHNPHPELIFLDIQLSDGLSFEIFDQLEVASSIIFTTAYDQYAIQAFKLNSVDYLLKPIVQSELKAALAKFKTQNNSAKDLDILTIKKLISGIQTPSYKSRFSVKIGQRIKLINTTDVTLVHSFNKGVFLRTKDARDYLVDLVMDDMELELDPKLFFRVNRQHLINIKAITDIVNYTNSRLQLKVIGYCESPIIVARERVKDFKNWLG